MVIAYVGSYYHSMARKEDLFVLLFFFGLVLPTTVCWPLMLLYNLTLHSFFSRSNGFYLVTCAVEALLVARASEG